MVERTKLFLWIPQLEIPSSEPQISPEDPEVKKVTVLVSPWSTHLCLNALRIFPTGIALKGQLQFASCSLKE